ncbi:MAG: YetF domain-containing protein [Candidatus Babeliales bacterium]
MKEHTFDLYRIFIGSSFSFVLLGEILFRTSFIYLYTVLNIRLMNKQSMGMLSSFEIIIIFALGTAVGDSMIYPHVPLIQAMLVISTIVFLERILAQIAEKFYFFEKYIVGFPELIIKNGKIIPKILKKQSLSKDELFSALRLKGIKDLGQVEYAYVEPSGNISVIKQENGKQEESITNHLK